MYTLFVILIVLAALLMIGIVLIQESKGGGLSSNFSQSNQFMGVRRTTDFIEKTTWGLAAAMVVLSVICAYVAPQGLSEQGAMEKAATSAPAQTNPATAPNFGASQAEAPAQQAPSQQAPAQQAPAQQAPAQEAPAN